MEELMSKSIDKCTEQLATFASLNRKEIREKNWSIRFLIIIIMIILFKHIKAIVLLVFLITKKYTG